MTDHLSGVGDVVIKRSGETVATRVSYSAYLTHPDPGRLGSIDAEIDVPTHVAVRLIGAGHLLTLRMQDGREFDFYVQRVSGAGYVRVQSSGGVRDSEGGA
jgi:hypothetical protein